MDKSGGVADRPGAATPYTQRRPPCPPWRPLSVRHCALFLCMCCSRRQCTNSRLGLLGGGRAYASPNRVPPKAPFHKQGCANRLTTWLPCLLPLRHEPPTCPWSCAGYCCDSNASPSPLSTHHHGRPSRRKGRARCSRGNIARPASRPYLGGRDTAFDSPPPLLLSRPGGKRTSGRVGGRQARACDSRRHEWRDLDSLPNH